MKPYYCCVPTIAISKAALSNWKKWKWYHHPPGPGIPGSGFTSFREPVTGFPMSRYSLDPKYPNTNRRQWHTVKYLTICKHTSYHHVVKSLESAPKDWGLSLPPLLGRRVLSGAGTSISGTASGNPIPSIGKFRKSISWLIIILYTGLSITPEIPCILASILDSKSLEFSTSALSCSCFRSSSLSRTNSKQRRASSSNCWWLGGSSIGEMWCEFVLVWYKKYLLVSVLTS